LTIDKGRFTLRPSQAGPGNDINAGSGGFQKAPTRGPASLVAMPIGYHMGRFGPVRLADVVFQDRWGQPYRDL
jgi:hypothetical protein